MITNLLALHVIYLMQMLPVKFLSKNSNMNKNVNRLEHKIIAMFTVKSLLCVSCGGCVENFIFI